MTASPHRLRSQNAANTANSERLRPANGPSRVDDSHLRTLPPTLFRLRNLNIPRPQVAASVAFEAEASDYEIREFETNSDGMAYASKTDDIETSSTKSVNVSQNETQNNETQEIASTASSQRSFVSRLSSQSLVLFIILAIAITGIVIGNRGGEQVANTQSSLKESLLADSDPIYVDLGSASEAIEAAASEQLVLTNENVVPSSPSEAKQAGSNSAFTSESPAPNAIVHTQAVDAPGSESVPSDIDAESLSSGHLSRNIAASAAPPQQMSQDSAMADSLQPNSVNPAQVNLGVPTSLASSNSSIATSPVAISPGATSPSASGEEGQVASVIAATDQVPTRSTSSGYVQTETPAGVNDWLRYLPSVNVAVTQAGTVAVSETPRSPVASYQQYLDSTSPANAQVAAPVGYLQDTYDSYRNDTVGTQAQLPVSTSSTQRR